MQRSRQSPAGHITGNICAGSANRLAASSNGRRELLRLLQRAEANEVHPIRPSELGPSKMFLFVGQKTEGRGSGKLNWLWEYDHEPIRQHHGYDDAGGP